MPKYTALRALGDRRDLLMEGVGRFGWVTDPEGNRIELWQPEWRCFHDQPAVWSLRWF